MLERSLVVLVITRTDCEIFTSPSLLCVVTIVGEDKTFTFWFWRATSKMAAKLFSVAVIENAGELASLSE